jgi:hypothetical protein
VGIDWLARESGTRFAAFRVALGLVLLADIAHLWAHRDLFVDEWPAAVPLGPLLGVWLVVLGAFTCGFWTRRAAVANYLLAAALLGQRSAISQIAGDSLAISLSLLAIFLPCRAGPSLDRWFRRGEEAEPSFVCERWALAGLLSLVYVDSALRKLDSGMWRAGLGAVAPAGLPSLVWLDTSWLEFLPAPLLRAAGLAVIAFELLFPILYAWRWTRTLAVLTGLSLHLGIAVLYPFPAFSGLMLAIYLGLLPEGWYAPLERLDGAVASCLGGRRFPAGAGSIAGSRTPRRAFHLPGRAACLLAVSWLGLTVVGYVADKLPSPAFGAIWGRVQPAVFRATGIMDHGVFNEVLFTDYRYQVRLVPAGPGQRQGGARPYSRDGLFGWTVRDRVWEHWWKRTQAPWVGVEDAERRLGRWALFYWGAGISPREVRVEARSQEVALDRLDAGVFRRNLAAPWRVVGQIRLAPDRTAQVRWLHQPQPSERSLGQFLNRVLAAGFFESPGNGGLGVQVLSLERGGAPGRLVAGIGDQVLRAPGGPVGIRDRFSPGKPLRPPTNHP